MLHFAPSTLSPEINAFMEVCSPPPAVKLPEHVLTGEYDHFFEPVRVSPPSTTPLVLTSLPTSVKDDMWYISIASDDVFEYRSVEVPFELLDGIQDGGPNRNYTEAEWRSIGITQSRGWENYFRSFTELNIFMFRRPRPDADKHILLARICEQLTADLRQLEDMALDAATEQQACHQFRDCFNFPMMVFDPQMREASKLPACDTTGFFQTSAITSEKRLLEYQAEVLRFSLTVLRQNN